MHHKPGLWFGIFLLAYNNLLNLLPSTFHVQIYVWLNLGILCLLWFWARHYLKLRLGELGWTKQNLGKSLLLGLGLTLLIILLFLALIRLLPILGLNLKSPHLEEISRDTIWLRLFFRIPLGTVLFEEMLFRGVLYGYLVKKGPTVKPVLVSSLFFGLWHITPGFKVVNLNLQIGSLIWGIIIWFLLLLGAFVAGLLFAEIRHRTRNIAGCLLAHFLINSLGLVIIYWVWK